MYQITKIMAKYNIQSAQAVCFIEIYGTKYCDIKNDCYYKDSCDNIYILEEDR